MNEAAPSTETTPMETYRPFLRSLTHKLAEYAGQAMTSHYDAGAEEQCYLYQCLLRDLLHTVQLTAD